ncbi:MAG: stage III sporulation protein AE, partial [Firmicutes bacterium HGW-Firmicutes-13]
LLASLGSLASTAIFQPLIIFSANFFSLLIKELVFPLIFFATILMLLDHFSQDFKISRLGQLFKDAAVFIMGFSLTIFGGILAVSGIAGAVSDGVTLRTAKFVTGAFIPIIGGMIADSLDAVVGASLLLKNGLVLAGVIMLFLITAFPLLKIVSIIFIYKLSSALIQPLGENSLCDCLNTMGNCLFLIFAAVTAVTLIFFIVIIMIMGAGNAAVMFRA